MKRDGGGERGSAVEGRREKSGRVGWEVERPRRLSTTTHSHPGHQPTNWAKAWMD